MLKKIFWVGALSLSLVALLGTGAEARCRYISGVAFCSDFCVESCWSGLGNLDQEPVEVVVSVGVEKAAVLCQNNGGNAETAQGKPFAVLLTPVDIGSAAVTSGDLVGRGRACVGGEDSPDFCIDGGAIYDAIADQLPANPCQNRNWSVVPDAVLSQGLVYYQAFYTATGSRVSAASGCQRCTRVLDADGCRYDCTAKSNATCIDAGLECTNPIIGGGCYPP